jgi:hypothetical protein
VDKKGGKMKNKIKRYDELRRASVDFLEEIIFSIKDVKELNIFLNYIRNDYLKFKKSAQGITPMPKVYRTNKDRSRIWIILYDSRYKRYSIQEILFLWLEGLVQVVFSSYLSHTIGDNSNRDKDFSLVEQDLINYLGEIV